MTTTIDDLNKQLANELNFHKKKAILNKIKALEKASKKPNVEQPTQLPLL